MSVLRFGPTCEPSRDVSAVPLYAELGIERTPEPTHDRCPGGEHTSGVIGGWDCPCECHRKPAPGVLWKQADDEHPDDIDASRRRYRELMIEHGHLIPGKPEPLPCGWSPSQHEPSTASVMAEKRSTTSAHSGATDSHASVSPEQTPSPAADSAHRGEGPLGVPAQFGACDRTTSGGGGVSAYPTHLPWRIECRGCGAWLVTPLVEDVQSWVQGHKHQLPASDSHASVSPEQTPTPAADSAHSGDQCTVVETP